MFETSKIYELLNLIKILNFFGKSKFRKFWHIYLDVEILDLLSFYRGISMNSRFLTINPER